MKKWSERSKKNKISFIISVFAWVLIALAAYVVYGLHQKTLFVYLTLFIAMSTALAADLVKQSETCTKNDLIKRAIITLIGYIIIIFVI